MLRLFDRKETVKAGSCLLVILVFFAPAADVPAEEIYWTDAAAYSNSWCTSGNWSSGIVPGQHDNALIDLADGFCSEIGADCRAVCSRLTVAGPTGACCLSISGGDLRVAADCFIGDQDGNSATVNLTGGTVEVYGKLGVDGTSRVQLDGGSLSVGTLTIGENAFIDITGGTLIVDGHALETVWGYADAGRLTGRGGIRVLNIDFDIRNPHKTTVTADSNYPPNEAWNPRPFNSAVSVDTTVTLRWTPADSMRPGTADAHLVYFGTDYDLVKNAAYGDPELQEMLFAEITEWKPLYVWDQNLPQGRLPLWKTFYWRVDEYLGDPFWEIHTGQVWSFTTRPIYVDAGTGGANNGSSWADAYKYLQDALADPNLLTAGPVWVAEGVYRPDANTSAPGGTGLRTAGFCLADGVKIYGGFASGGGFLWDRNPRRYGTILSGDIGTPDTSGDNSFHVIFAYGAGTNSAIDGFTITGGNADGAEPDNCGGGMYIFDGRPTITDCRFIANSAQTGGGLCNRQSSPIVINCSFAGNTGTESGGGIYNTDGSMPAVVNCIFTGNSAQNGGGMSDSNSSPAITNCTFSGNEAAAGGAIYGTEAAGPGLTNSCLWGNTAGGGAQVALAEGSILSLAYCDIEGGFTAIAKDLTTTITWGPGNIEADPLFADPAGPDGVTGTEDDNVRLIRPSPCVDAGTNAPAGQAADLPDTDIDGYPRIIDGDCNGVKVADIGAYEFNYAYLGDVDFQCDVDLEDFAVFASAWMSRRGDTQWNGICDIGTLQNDRIDWNDLQVLAANWLTSLQ